jgi:hypothetical protein
MDENRTGRRTGGEGAGRADKPLGRGLEDVSHLFLSQRIRAGAPVAPRPEAPVTAPAPPPAAADSPRSSSPEAVPLRPVTSISRADLAGVLRRFDVGLEDGLSPLDEAVPCPPCGAIDLMAVDRANQLTIIDFETSPSDALLVRGMGHVDWIVRNVPVVRRMYTGRTINFSALPRLLLLAPEFSPVSRRIVRFIAGPKIELVRYQLVHAGQGLGILFDRLPPS